MKRSYRQGGREQKVMSSKLLEPKVAKQYSNSQLIVLAQGLDYMIIYSYDHIIRTVHHPLITPSRILLFKFPTTSAEAMAGYRPTTTK